jgi:F-type H+-transporting ATPase subunit delta
MEEIARVYAEALFDVAKEKDKLDRIHDELNEFAEAMRDNRDLQVFFFSPYFSTAEKRDGIERAVSDADPEFVNFLELLAEKHRMPLIFRIQGQFEERWKEENRMLDVTVTSAVELDPEIVKKIGAEIEKQTDRSVELRSAVDENLLGGIVLQVGNMVLDASIRNRLEKLRRNIVRAA